MTSEIDTFLCEAPSRLVGTPTARSFRHVLKSVVHTQALAVKLSQTQALGSVHRRLVLARLMLVLRRTQELSTLLENKKRRVKSDASDSLKAAETQLANVRRETVLLIMSESSDLQLDVTETEVLAMAHDWKPGWNHFPNRA